ncbi:MAG: hypothetical protein WBA23_16215 [Tunicatimonas sp.]|uniref:hypothetical protein n=1 Tax=Tunicatimonas sp. TaxID=1940096 RepID=UPI003C70959E
MEFPDHDFYFTSDYTFQNQHLKRFVELNRLLNSDNSDYKIKQSHEQTMQRVLSLYTKQISKFYNQASLQAFYDQHGYLPPFRTMGTSLQKTLHMGSIGTVYAHRQRLLNTGAILKVETDHINKCQYWFINPVFFCLKQRLTSPAYPEDGHPVDKFVHNHFSARKSLELQMPKNAKIQSSISKNAHIIAKNIIYIESIVSSVDNVDNCSTSRKIRNPAKPDNGKSALNLPGNFAKNTKKQRNFREKSKNDFAAQPIDKSSVIPRNNSKPAAANIRPEIPAFILKMVVNFWQYAKSTLYRGQVFSEEEEKWAKNTIYKTFFGEWRKNGSPSYWKNRYKTLRNQVILSKIIVNKNGYQVPKPGYYFSPPNPKAQTEFKFYKTYEMVAETTFQVIETERKRWKVGQGAHKKKDGLALMQRHFRMIYEIGHPKYIAKFDRLRTYGYYRSAEHDFPITSPFGKSSK